MTEHNASVDHRAPPWPRGFLYYARCNVRRMPRLINLEITKRCNAKCSFCAYWHDREHVELDDYVPVIRKFKPVVVSITGGEPLIRKNHVDIIRGIRPYCHYVGLVTNGSLLDRTRAARLVDAGVNHISVSLDYLGSKHDVARGLTGLYEHIAGTIPDLASKGYRIVLNTIIMESNLDQVLPIAYQAKEWGVSVSYSSYCSLKKDDDDEMVRTQRFTQLVGIVDELKSLKRSLGNIKNSDHYLDGVAPYFRDGGRDGCRAGVRWVQITPDGYVQQCSELPKLCHFTEYRRARMSSPVCTRCWYTCRGEAEAHPLKPSRLLELIKA